MLTVLRNIWFPPSAMTSRATVDSRLSSVTVQRNACVSSKKFISGKLFETRHGSVEVFSQAYRTFGSSQPPWLNVFVYAHQLSNRFAGFRDENFLAGLHLRHQLRKPGLCFMHVDGNGHNSH